MSKAEGAAINDSLLAEPAPFPHERKGPIRRMSNLLLLSLFFTLLLAASTVRAHAPFGRPGYINAHLNAFRTHVNDQRRAKCYPAFRFKFTPAELQDASDLIRKRARVTYKRRHYGIHAATSRCLNVFLMTWYRTSGAECVHREEGAWNAVNPAGPYYGGFQADIAFQRAYGPEYLRRKGTANHWLPIEQIHMAYRGWDARGWHPWPNTARECGLL